MIRTSYFAKYRGDKGVCIANSQPKGMKLTKYHDLIPEWYLVRNFKNGLISEEEYRDEYFEQLDRLDVNDVYSDLRNKTLLCWEKSEKFCHRHIIAEWMRENGYDCEEEE